MQYHSTIVVKMIWMSVKILEDFKIHMGSNPVVYCNNPWYVLWGIYGYERYDKRGMAKMQMKSQSSQDGLAVEGQSLIKPLFAHPTKASAEEIVARFLIRFWWICLVLVIILIGVIYVN